MDFNPDQQNIDLDSYLNGKEYIFISDVTKEYVNMTYNWFLNLKKLNLEKNCLIIAWDQIAYQELIKLEIPTLLFDKNVNSFNIFEGINVIKRINLISSFIKKYKINTVRCDVDVIFQKNPIEKFNLILSENPEVDCLFSSSKNSIEMDLTITKNKNDLGLTDFNLFYVKYEEKYLKFLDFLIGFDINQADALYNNTYFEYNQVLNETDADGHFFIVNYLFTQNNIKYKFLSKIEFPNGSMLENEILKNNILNGAYAIHYNFNKTPSNKIVEKVEEMKKNGHWLID